LFGPVSPSLPSGKEHPPEMTHYPSGNCREGTSLLKEEAGSLLQTDVVALVSCYHYLDISIYHLPGNVIEMN
jgi:hypothetical protein